MMTTREKTELIGRLASLRVDDFGFIVSIRDVREVYGRTDYLVIPLEGRGESWVASSRCKLISEGGAS